ncbi:MAG: BppU family phage baseplate upper protein, partial [Acutalibacteraceae bacterium]
MERVEHRIKLNLMKTGLQGQVNVKKADTDSRKVCIYLSYAAKPFDLNDVVSAVLRAEKPDGKVMFNSCTVCEDRLEYIITTQTIAATGTVTCEITLTSNSGQILVTPRFEIIVADVIYSDSEIESTNEYTALEKAIKKASALKDGTTFTPSVSDEGVLSWSNSDGKDNPAAVNIKGPKGDPGAKGDKGKPGKDGASELFIVNVQAQSGADGYTITSHNKTYEQIDAAYKAGKQVLIAFTVTNENNTFLIPLGIATETDYEFLVFANAVFYVYVDNTDTWDCYVEPLEADSIKAKISADSSAQSLSLQTILNSLVYPAVEKAHEHSNKSVLDGLSDSNGVLYYNNKPIIAQKISEGPYITLADNTEYRLTDVTTLKLSYPVGDFESWMRLTFAASGDITVTLPAGTGYIGTAPDFKNGET